MMTSRRWLGFLTVLLVLSGGLNVYLLWRRAHPAATGPSRGARLGPGAARGAGPALGRLVPDLGGRPGWTFPPSVDADAGPRRGTSAADRTTLCWIAEQEVRYAWAVFGDQTRQLLHDYLAEPNEQAQRAVEKVEDIQQVLGLSDRDAQELGDAYAPVRHRRVTEIRYLLERDPPDWSGVFDTARQLYKDENLLVENRFGAGRAATLREAENIERLLLLTGLASLAGRPWEGALER